MTVTFSTGFSRQDAGLSKQKTEKTSLARRTIPGGKSQSHLFIWIGLQWKMVHWHIQLDDLPIKNGEMGISHVYVLLSFWNLCSFSVSKTGICSLRNCGPVDPPNPGGKPQTNPLDSVGIWTTCTIQLPSGNLFHSYWKWPLIVSLPMMNGDFP